jgi:hypothetical protein
MICAVLPGAGSQAIRMAMQSDFASNSAKEVLVILVLGSENLGNMITWKLAIRIFGSN